MPELYVLYHELWNCGIYGRKCSRTSKGTRIFCVDRILRNISGLRMFSVSIGLYCNVPRRHRYNYYVSLLSGGRNGGLRFIGIE